MPRSPPPLETSWPQSPKVLSLNGPLSISLQKSCLITKYTITFIVNSEDCIQQLILQDYCVSWIEKQTPLTESDLAKSFQKRTILHTAEIELSDNNVSYSHMRSVLNARFSKNQSVTSPRNGANDYFQRQC